MFEIGLKIGRAKKGLTEKSLNPTDIFARNSLSGYDFMTWIKNGIKIFDINFNSSGDLVVAYNKCSPVSTVINRLATSMANGKWWIVDDADSDVIDKYPNIKSIIDNPNPFQSWQEFIIQLDIYRNIFGEVFIYSPTKTGFEKQALFVLKPTLVKPIVSKQIDFFSKKEDIITGYEYNATYFRRVLIEPKDILHIKDVYQNLSDDAIQFSGKSRLTSLEYEIRNVIQAQEAIYSLNSDRGAQGILSNSKKDADGMLPMTKQQKEEIQQEYKQQYGLRNGQRKIIITDASLQWQQMSYNVRDLMLFEGIKQNIESITDAFNYPFELLANSKGSTYANKNEAKKSLYQDGIMPISDIYSQAFTTFFQLNDGHKFTIDFSHIECLQEAEKEKAESKRALNMANKIAFESGIISAEEWREDLGLDQQINGGTMVNG